MYNEYYIVEYSIQQKCYHLSTLGSIIKANISLILNREENGYVIIGGLFKTLQDAKEYRDKFQNQANLPLK